MFDPNNGRRNEVQGSFEEAAYVELKAEI